MDIELRREILDYCVLAVIKEEESYGDMIIKQMESLLPISESTLYPILKRLESNKLVSSYSVEHNGRLRKYYQITPNGIENLNEFVVSWKEVETIFNYIKGVSEND